MPPQTELDASAISNRDESCTGGADQCQEGMNCYSLATKGNGIQPGLPVIAVANESNRFRHNEEHLTADLDNDGRDEYFQSCTSSEGVHFTVWTGRPPQGEVRWHQYFYLGYDVSPTCTPKEESEPKK